MTLRAMNRIPLDAPSAGAHGAQPFFARAAGSAFEVRAAGADVAELQLYDEIGFWGITANDFRKVLNGVKASTIVLDINSPGGDVFDGIAMFNDLVNHPAKIEVRVTGLAASAASIIAMAGDEIAMAPNAFMMIHNAWACGCGNKSDLRAVADILDKIDVALVDTYVDRTGADKSDVVTMMADESWLSASAAVDKGFADKELTEAVEAAAHFDLSIFNQVPDALKADPGAPQTKRDFERMLTQDAGLPRSQARALMGGGYDSLTATQDAGGQALTDLIAALARREQIMKD